jgi:hypothetical protein
MQKPHDRIASLDSDRLCPLDSIRFAMLGIPAWDIFTSGLAKERAHNFVVISEPQKKRPLL